MKTTFVAAVLALSLGASAQTRSREPVEVKPETVGFSTERLQRLHALLEQQVEEKAVAGVVTMLARHGKIVDARAYGKKDLASGAPMDKDAIFRIYSMTKPVTGVAMMMLYEEGKWSPADPVSKFIPEFADLKVQGKNGLEAPAHAPTMAELMSHTAGFTYGIFGSTAVDKLYRDANVFGSANLQEFAGKLAKIPLLYQPGTEWVYSVSVDIQGYIVEKLSGKPLGTFFRDQIFTPLGMKDSGFHVDLEKAARLATTYSAAAPSRLTAVPANAASFTKEPSMPSGGGGLYSTARDYLRFSEMLQNGGELDGVRLLAPSSVKLMRTNRLPRSVQESGQFGIGFFRINPGFGFGYDFGVFTNPGATGRTVGEGTYMWDGAAGTWFWIDPTNDIVFVGMIQVTGAGRPNLATLTQQAVYQALVAPEK
jgi:CubicO group peptidase (beta-lactamase class C family)